ncbi:MAG: MiaB/RimO family radical SAM methylthiotransferase [Gaiellales bacterium]
MTTIVSMGTFSSAFLGCKVSYMDARDIGDRLRAGGLVDAADAVPDVAFVSTCCVTHEALRKSRKVARRAAARAKRVYVTGCAANLRDAMSDLPANVAVVAGSSEETPDLIAREVGAPACTNASHRHDRVRAFVKIQDGCSFSCAFCVIPSVRGASRSRSAVSVLDEVRRRVREGHGEIVLSGVNLGCFRDKDAGYDLARLVRETGSTEGVRRLRLSSIEPNHLTVGLLEAMAGTESAGPHLHVPLQSGDDRVLAAMQRRYTSGEFLRKVERAQGFNLTTDVIVGFPNEDDDAFARTLEVVERAGITKVHVFPYSPRPGTRTAALDTVLPEVKRERGRRLRAASDAACAQHWRTKIGETATVLIDRPGRGYAEDYTPWMLDGPVGAFVRAPGAAVTAEGVRAA